jgi:hypothetical protein
VGPYETVRVGAADGSARRWLDALGFDVPSSFDAAAAELERAGYELHVLHARAPAPSSLVRSFRIATTSPDATFPLRLLRMGSSADQAPTPVTLMTLATTPLTLANQTVTTIDEAFLGASGSSSNYEALVANALGAPVAPVTDGGADGGAVTDGGAPGATHWLLESSRSLVLGPSGDGGAGATVGGLFQSKCGSKAPETHVVCSVLSTSEASPTDGGGADAGDAGDAGADAGGADAGSATDGGTSDASTTSDAGSDCSDVSRESCDDLDLVLGASVASRFRGSIVDDARSLADLALVPAPGPLRDARYFVRPNGVPGTCEAPAGGLSAEADASTTCSATTVRLRFDAGPLAMLLGVVYALQRIMRRRRP